MAQDYPRRYRVADQIQRELGELLRGLKDPRLADGMVTVASVDVSPDLRNARVYVTLLDCTDAAEVLAGLRAAAGHLRSQLARRLTLRVVPELRFYHDETPDRVDRIQALLDDALRRK